MKRMMALMVLAICVMMVAPVAMAGKPGGGAATKYSTFSKNNGVGDIVAGPSKGKWMTNGNWYVWDVGHQGPKAGPISTYNPPSALSAYGTISPCISSGAHLESAGIESDNSWLDPNGISPGIYNPPCNEIKSVYVCVQLPNWGYNGNIDLTIRGHLRDNPEYSQISVQISSNHQMTIDGTLMFVYYDVNTSPYMENPYATQQNAFHLVVDF